MAVVKPFSAWQYNNQKIQDLNTVIAPPYDVISEADLTAMKTQSPYNYTNIILPEGENKHSRAGELYREWQREKILVQDSKPALYFYRQKFHLTKLESFCQNFEEGGALARTALFCRVGLEDYANKMILPHEKTFSGPKADRYKLMEEAQGNMEPVFLGYDSPRFSGDEFAKIILGKNPSSEFTDSSGVVHEMWTINDDKVIAEVEKVLASKKFYILDGHHRYETALKFYKDHQRTDARLDHRYVLAAICSFRQAGTVILPTHRAVKNGDKEAFQKQVLKMGWTLNPVDTRDELERNLRESATTSFGLKINGTKGYVFLKDETRREKLDLEILHEELLPLLSATPEIDYIKDIAELEAGVEKGVYQLGILVRPSTVEEVMTVAEKGAVMPHKSTFFYPKIPSGLVINSFL